MTAPSSPVPTVGAELSNEELLDEALSLSVVFMHSPEVEDEAVAAHAAVLARMSTPTPGRAAEPDTMGEVERLVDEHADAVGAHALLAVRAAISPRYEEDAAKASNEAKVTRDALLFAVQALRTRAETVQAQLATAEREREQIALAICGGEDAPGYAASLSVDDLKKVIADRLDSKEWTDTQIAALDALSNPKADR